MATQTKPLVQSDFEIREMTDEEYADYLLYVEEAAKATAERERLDAEKAAARADLLERLGLTEDEARVLLG